MAARDGSAGPVGGARRGRIAVEVACATPEKQLVVSLDVPAGATAAEAVALSGIAERFEDIDVAGGPMGVFSRRLDGKTLPLPGEYVLKPGDRVEIYRPLATDPKQARRARAKSAGRRRTGP